MNPPYLRPTANGVLLSVKVQPRSSKNEVVGILADELKIKVAAPPVDDAANTVLLRFLAEVLGCSRSAVTLVKGHTSRHKTIAVHGLQPADVAERLGVSSET